MIKEEWKSIINYEGLYEISNYGNIRSISSRWGKRNNPRIVTQTITSKKYKRITLSKNNHKKTYMVHILVYESFKGKIPSGYEINHIDYNRQNNYLENLEILTHKENVRYSKAKKVIQYDRNNKLIKVWDCIRDIERELNIDHRQIVANLKGKQKSCHNYIFEYKEVV